MSFIDLLKETGNFVDYASEQKKAWDEATREINEKLIMNDEEKENNTMKELTKEQFMEEIEAFDGTDTTFNVGSLDGGGIYLSMEECIITVDKDFSEIQIFKPYTHMGACICLNIVDSIKKTDDGEYHIEFNNGLADVIIKPLQKTE